MYSCNSPVKENIPQKYKLEHKAWCFLVRRGMQISSQPCLFTWWSINPLDDVAPMLLLPANTLTSLICVICYFLYSETGDSWLSGSHHCLLRGGRSAAVYAQALLLDVYVPAARLALPMVVPERHGEVPLHARQTDRTQRRGLRAAVRGSPAAKCHLTDLKKRQHRKCT